MKNLYISSAGEKNQAAIEAVLESGVLKGSALN